MCALQLKIESTTGYEVQDAYVKVDEYSCYGDTVHARLRAYVSQQASIDGKAHIEGSEEIVTLKVDYSDDACNTKKQIYEHTKMLDKYADAIDV